MWCSTSSTGFAGQPRPRPRGALDCKAGKCGCVRRDQRPATSVFMTRMSTFTEVETRDGDGPMRTFPVIRDLSPHVSVHYQKAGKIPSSNSPRLSSRRVPDCSSGRPSASQEFRKCIECCPLSQQPSTCCATTREQGVRSPAPPPFLSASPIWRCTLWTAAAAYRPRSPHALDSVNITSGSPR